MATLQGLDKGIAEKWGIDPSKYGPWVSGEEVLEVLNKYMEKANIPSQHKLAEIMGLHPQSIYQLRDRKGRKMMAAIAGRWLDSLNIDPKIVFKPAATAGKDILDPITEAFLGTFSNKREQAKMIKYCDKIRTLIQRLEENEALKNANL